MNQPEHILIESRTPPDTSGRLSFYVITFFIGLTFILIMSQWGYSVIESSNMPNEMPGIIGINSMQSAMGKALLALVGGVFLILPSPYRTSRQYRITPLLFISGYLLICISSVVWSADAGLTVRRLLVLLFYIIGILGTARHVSTRQLLDIVIVVALIFIALGITDELINGTFTPLEGDYRFAGTMHPNSQGSICAILVLSAYCLLKQAGSNRWIYLSAIVIGILFLFLTKSRSNIFACFIAAYLTSFWKTSFRAKQLLILIPLVFISMTILTISLSVPDFLERLDELINLGRNLDSSQTLSLTGRIPLWVYLKDYILQKPFLGYGYQGFWTPDIIESTFNEFGWVITSSHSLIIDLLLQLGLVGALVYGLSVLSILKWVVKDCTVNGSPEILFTFAITIYACVFGLLESQFLNPKTFGAFIISVALFNCCIIKHAAIAKPLP